LVASWWLIGDLSSKGIDRPLDYVVRAPAFSSRLVMTVGVAGLVMTAIVLVDAAVRVVRSNGAARHEAVVVVASAVGGCIVAGSLRVLTAGSVGGRRTD
jgi:hypothetical protein